MAVTDILKLLVAISIGYLTSILAYRLFFSPLQSVPGPLICRLTSLWTYYHSYVGDDCSLISELHEKYGPVVRIAPNEVSIADGTALAPIYSEKGGFIKAPCYSNFDIEGHKTIFSARDPAHRAVRSKAVLPMFSMANIRSGSQEIEKATDLLIARLQEEAAESRKTKQPVNVLNLARSLALDAASGYLFGKPFGGIHEKSDDMTANAYVDALVAVGRFFFLPNWLFLLLEETRLKYFISKHEDESTAKVATFAEKIVQASSSGDATYQSRLLKAGIAVDETEVQCKDLIFAGTDSTGNNFASICWFLAKNPETYQRLRTEINEADPETPILTLKYLDAVVREGLRLAMANPSRFPRVVPAQGWTFTPTSTPSTTHRFPPNTTVGIQPYTLHLNPSIYPSPHAFRPERWLDASPEMNRDWIPFGQGARQCIARNLAMMELLIATRAVAASGVLEGARCVVGEIERLQWFNSRVVGDRIELVWG